MTAEELAKLCQDYALKVGGPSGGQRIDRISEACAGRIREAASKYALSPDEQGFERATVGTMIVGLQEEVLDLINYAAMIQVLIDRSSWPEGHQMLSMDLFSVAGQAARGAANLEDHLKSLVTAGLYTPRTEGTYEGMLREEQIESLIKEQGLPDMGLSSPDG